jgi:hypothetical protein
VAVNYEIGGEDQENNDDKALIRFEFIELMIRIAREKYFNSGEVDSLGKALELTLDRNVRLASRAEEWNNFRKNMLYNVAVNDIFTANVDLLMEVYILISTGKKLKMDKRTVKENLAQDLRYEK